MNTRAHLPQSFYSYLSKNVPSTQPQPFLPKLRTQGWFDYFTFHKQNRFLFLKVTLLLHRNFKLSPLGAVSLIYAQNPMQTTTKIKATLLFSKIILFLFPFIVVILLHLSVSSSSFRIFFPKHLHEVLLYLLLCNHFFVLQII